MLSHQKDLLIAVMFVLGAAFFYSIMAVLVRMVDGAVPISVILFIRFTVGFAVLSPFIIVRLRKGTFTFKINRFWLQILRGIAGVLAIGFYYAAINYMPLVNATLLNITYPLFMPLIVWIVFKVPSTKSMIMAILLGFIGVVFVLQPGHVSFQWADLLGLASGLCAAVAILSIRLLSKTESKLSVLTNYFLVAIVLTGIVSIFQWQTVTWEMWRTLLLIGIAATMYQYMLTAALSKAPARVVTPLLYSALIFTGLMDWYIWQYVPDVLSIIGMTIVVISAIAVIILRSREPAEPQ